MQLSDFLPPENALIDQAARSKSAVLRALARAASLGTGLPEEVIHDALVSRERLGSTGIGNGIAIPHARLPGLRQPFGLLLRLAWPIDFDAVDDNPVDIVFLLLVPEQNGQAHLQPLACAARRLRAPEALRALRAAQTPQQLYAAATAEKGAAAG